MKTPDEIKKGMEGLKFIANAVRIDNALSYIQRLEADNAQQARCIENLTDKLNATNDALPRWISVEERLPEKGVFVVVYYGHFIGNLMDVYMWDGECWRSSSGYLEDAENITHWMPLPEPPKEEYK